MKNILFLTTQLPYPPKSGGTVKSWNYVQFLSKNYSLSIACLLKGEDENHLLDFKEKIPLTNFIHQFVHVPRSALSLIKSYFFSPCLNAFRNRSDSFKKEVRQLSLNQDVIIVDHYEMFQYVPSDFKGTVVLHTHNAEFMLWKRMSELESNPFKKVLLYLESMRVKKYERKICGNSDLIYATPSDIQLYESNGFDVSRHAITFHLGNDTLLDLADLNFDDTEKAITFMGTLSWEPNIDGIVWFLHEVWPIIIASESETTLYILGSSPDSRIKEAANKDPRIQFTGFVADLESYLKKSRVYIAPLRFGSGMKVKVLEGLYRGVPTVSTSVGAEGLEVSNGQEIFIADAASDFAVNCLNLLNDKQKWESLRTASRKVAAEKYRWSPLFEKMNRELRSLIQ